MLKIKERLSDQQEQQACEMAADGEKFKTIAQALGFQNSSQLSQYRKYFPDFEYKFQDAVSSYNEDLEAEMIVIPHKYDKDTATLLSNNIKWLLSVRDPKRYAPRQQNDVNVTIDIGGALERASQRVLDITPNNVLSITGKKD